MRFSRNKGSIPLWIHGFVWGTLLLLVLLLAGVIQTLNDRDVWNGWTESAGLRQPSYAERIYLHEVFRTRANTWSNLFYVVVGLYAIGLGCQDRKERPQASSGYLRATPPMSFLFGAACCYLGLGSGLFHASLTRWGQQLDVAAMYSPLVVCIATSLGRWFPRMSRRQIPTWPVLGVLVIIACAFLYIYKWSMRSGVVLPGLILAVTVLALADRFKRGSRFCLWWIIPALLGLVAARICWLLDVAGRFSGPDSLFQGHSFWHLLTSISLAGIYFYNRSEQTTDPAPVAGPL